MCVRIHWPVFVCTTAIEIGHGEIKQRVVRSMVEAADPRFGKCLGRFRGPCDLLRKTGPTAEPCELSVTNANREAGMFRRTVRTTN
jgi:hypothetical protein